MTQACIFCRIVAGTAPARVVHRTGHALAFLDRSPATRGHTLVIPRQHAAGLWEVTRQDAAQVMAAVHDVAALLRDRLEPDGLNLFQANGAAAWQEVFHLHVHVVPRYAGDGLVRSWAPTAASPDELDQVLAQLR
jgi:histidine triad (HIT) family protein